MVAGGGGPSIACGYGLVTLVPATVDVPIESHLAVVPSTEDSIAGTPRTVHPWQTVFFSSRTVRLHGLRHTYLNKL
jgi:hypothetical protein